MSLVTRAIQTPSIVPRTRNTTASLDKEKNRCIEIIFRLCGKIIRYKEQQESPKEKQCEYISRLMNKIRISINKTDLTISEKLTIETALSLFNDKSPLPTKPYLKKIKKRIELRDTAIESLLCIEKKFSKETPLPIKVNSKNIIDKKDYTERLFRIISNAFKLIGTSSKNTESSLVSEIKRTLNESLKGIKLDPNEERDIKVLLQILETMTTKKTHKNSEQMQLNKILSTKQKLTKLEEDIESWFK